MTDPKDDKTKQGSAQVPPKESTDSREQKRASVPMKSIIDERLKTRLGFPDDTDSEGEEVEYVRPPPVQPRPKTTITVDTGVPLNTADDADSGGHFMTKA